MPVSDIRVPAQFTSGACTVSFLVPEGRRKETFVSPYVFYTFPEWRHGAPHAHTRFRRTPLDAVEVPHRAPGAALRGLRAGHCLAGR